ncbi:hypothetical protein [Thiomonas bhubaneswarensis]|uniref:Uncharacterized protein n=1 Tax=Thiomonas bhubaneswarensis TaxID=339866 RepID=A0A0K6I047_9BURK|nr:hypothetical protein [Thiomonas bhubaneswarensis]CUA96534.1 hypothetical protein Ga0061069_104177 [Thiomonas bhubaneswarensis]
MTADPYSGDLIEILRLRDGTSWYADSGRVYLCQGNLCEIGLPTHGLPPALLQLLMLQLRAGSTHQDLLFLFGRHFHRRARRVIADLEDRQVLRWETVQCNRFECRDARPFELVLEGSPDAVSLPSRCEIFVHSGAAATYTLPATLSKRVGAKLTLHDVDLGTGYLIVARRADSEVCMACQLLWFFGSRLLPLSFLGACLSVPSSGAQTVDHYRARVSLALTEMRDEEALLIYFPDDVPACASIDRPRARHPACGCTRFSRGGNSMSTPESIDVLA